MYINPNLRSTKIQFYMKYKHISKSLIEENPIQLLHKSKQKEGTKSFPLHIMYCKSLITYHS